MKLNFNSLAVINTVSLFSCLFIGMLFLFKKGGNSRANKYLSFFIFSCFFGASVGILYNTNLYYFIPHFIQVGNPFMFLLGPFVFFYVRTLTRPQRRFNILDILHFLPCVIFIIFMIPYYIKSADYKIQSIINLLEHGKSRFIIFTPFILIQIVTYFIIIIFMIRNHEKNIKENFSYLDKISLSWIRKFIYVFAIVNVVFLPLFFLVFAGLKFSSISQFLPISVSFAIFLIGYNAWVQPEIFFETKKDKTKNKNDKNVRAFNNLKNFLLAYDSNEDLKKYKKIKLSKEESERMLKTLMNYMDKEKPYLDSELTLPELADRISLSRNHLSYIVNMYYGENFYDFINRYRVEAAKKFLFESKDDDVSVLDIGYNSGFKSKSTFNKFFKKHTNKTPSQFKKEC